MVVNGTSVLQIELYNSPVKCHARPPRSRESNDPFKEKRCHYMYMKSLRNILSSSYGGERGKCATNWIAQLTCQVPRPPRSRESNDPFEVKRCHYMKSLRNILSSSYGGERGKCATNWSVQLTCQVPRPPRSRESNDPFEVKRCHCMKSLRNILSSSYGGERGKCATNWIAQLTCQVPHPPRSRESNDPFEVKRCHYMKSLRNILSSSYGGEWGKCATNWIAQLTCQVPRPPRSRESNDPFEVKRCHYMKSLRNILSSSYGGEWGKCDKLNVQLTCQVPRPPRSGESNDPFERRKGVTTWKA